MSGHWRMILAGAVSACADRGEGWHSRAGKGGFFARIFK